MSRLGRELVYNIHWCDTPYHRLRTDVQRYSLGVKRPRFRTLRWWWEEYADHTVASIPYDLILLFPIWLIVSLIWLVFDLVDWGVDNLMVEDEYVEGEDA